MLINEFSVIAAPYFFSAGYADTPNLNYTWSMNGRTIQNQKPKNSFTTRIEGDSSGTANINLKISNNTRIFQFIDKDFTIKFGNQ